MTSNPQAAVKYPRAEEQDEVSQYLLERSRLRQQRQAAGQSRAAFGDVEDSYEKAALLSGRESDPEASIDDGHYAEAYGHIRRPSLTMLRRMRPRLTWIILIIMTLSLGWLGYAFTRYAASSSKQPSNGSLFGGLTSTTKSTSPAGIKDSKFAPSKEPVAASPPPPVPSGPVPEVAVIAPSNPLPFSYPPASLRRKVEPVEAYRPLTSNRDALDQWFSQGRIHPSLFFPQDHESRKHDLVVSSANGSDWEHARRLGLYYANEVGSAIEEFWNVPIPVLAGAKTKSLVTSSGSLKARSNKVLEKRGKEMDIGVNRFREIDELRYVVRSAKQHLQGLDTIHLLTPSFTPPRPFDEPGPGLDAAAAKAAAPEDWMAVKYKHSSFRTENGRTQWGQVPNWLNPKHKQVFMPNTTDVKQQGAGSKSRESAKLRVHHDWQIYTPNWLVDSSAEGLVDQGWGPQDIVGWKSSVLPTFNSIAVESMLGSEGMEGLAENWVYANDDMFFDSDLSSTTFHSPLYGPTFRFDHSLPVRGLKVPSSSASGEWPSLQYSAYLLDQRFGARTRAYATHEPRVFNTKLLREMRMMWAQDFRSTGEDRFRFMSLDRPGSSTAFLMAHWTVERYREAVLWSFFVLRMDENGDGYIDIKELNKYLLRPLGHQSYKTQVKDLVVQDRMQAEIPFPYRSAMDGDYHLKQLAAIEFPRPLRTKYAFTAHEGIYPFLTLHPFVQTKSPARPPGGGKASGVGQVAQEPWPRYHPRPGLDRKSDTRFTKIKKACDLDLSGCMADLPIDESGQVRSEDIFKQWAFDKGEQCGDCLLVSLLGRSGAAGLSAVLPDEGKLFPAAAPAGDEAKKETGPPPAPPEEPHLPLTATFNPISSKNQPPGTLLPQDVPCFSLSCIANQLHWSSLSKREFAMKLLHRYTYTIAQSPGEFHMMQTEWGTRNFLAYLKEKKKDEKGEGGYAFIGLNDDYRENVAGTMKDLFTKWAKSEFSVASPWEE